jgi:uncharacterized protein CbrC (UPF0167 family)
LKRRDAETQRRRERREDAEISWIWCSHEGHEAIGTNALLPLDAGGGRIRVVWIVGQVRKMAENTDFRYFPNYKTLAQFESGPCSCHSTDQELSFLCLSGQYFANPDVPEAVCIGDLKAGVFRVYIDDYVTRLLEQSVRDTFPDWSSDQIQTHVERAVDELSRTPPVPWIQHNVWPSCHGDFCRYLGEWDQNKLNSMSDRDDRHSYLLSIIQEPQGVGDPERLWEEIGTGWTAIFAFECPSCGKLVAIDQSY